MSTDQLYGLKEVADIVGVHRATVLRWIETRKVAVAKKKNSSGHYVFLKEDVEALQRYHTSIHIVE